MLSEISQEQKGKCCVMRLTRGTDSSHILSGSEVMAGSWWRREWGVIVE